MGHKSGQRVRIGAEVQEEMEEAQENAVVRFAREHEVEAMKFLRATMRSQKVPRVTRMKAAEDILDRSRGKATQPIDAKSLEPKFQVIINKLTIAGPAELPDPKVIDVPAVEVEIVAPYHQPSKTTAALFGPE